MNNKRTHIGFIFLSLLLSCNLYASETSIEIVKSVKELCKAPSNKKSSFYEVSAKGKVDLRIKILGLAGANAIFKRKEWIGIQRVLQKDQLKDNESYRNCTMTLVPVFLKKFSNSVQAEKERLKTIQVRKERKKTIQKNSTVQKTYGNKSPIINQPTGTIIFN